MAQHVTHFIKYCKEVKMKKQIIILALITISLFGIFIVNAGLFGDLFGGDMKAKETSINMNTNELNFLKEKARITVCDSTDEETGECLTSHVENRNVAPVLDKPLCDSSNCKFHIYQQNIIDSDFIIPITYQNCKTYKVDEEGKATEECDVYETLEYSDSEIRNKADSYVKERLESYASASLQRAEKTNKEIYGVINAE